MFIKKIVKERIVDLVTSTDLYRSTFSIDHPILIDVFRLIDLIDVVLFMTMMKLIDSIVLISNLMKKSKCCTVCIRFIDVLILIKCLRNLFRSRLIDAIDVINLNRLLKKIRKFDSLRLKSLLHLKNRLH